jgi:hypothetical protein
MAIEWGNAINVHLAKQNRYNFNSEHWGSKILSISNWKYILQLWTVCNTEVHDDTQEKTEHIKRQEMIQEILYIQNTRTHLPLEARSLLDRDEKSLQGMNTSSITAYLYGAQMLTQSFRDIQDDSSQRRISTFFQPRLRISPTEVTHNGTSSTDATN